MTEVTCGLVSWLAMLSVMGTVLWRENRPGIEEAEDEPPPAGPGPWLRMGMALF